MTSSDDALRPASSVAGGERAKDAFGFRNRGLLGGLLLVPVAIAVVISEPTVRETGFAGLLLDAGGWIFFLLYVGLRIWATLFIGGHKDHELQTEGPYSLCRNPLYCGSLCFALSVACFLKSATFGAALLFAAFVYFQWVVRAEEHYLELRFQEDFRNYCRRTPRFWPRWSNFHTPAHIRVDLKRLKKEVIRLGRAALLSIVLQTVTQVHMAPWWPHWFSIP